MIGSSPETSSEEIMEYLYIPSTSAGKVWRAYIYKPEGKAAYAYAIEGTPTPGGGFSTRFGLNGDRQIKLTIEGTATLKRKREALHTIVKSMLANGQITEAEHDKAVAAIEAADTIEA